MVLPGRIQVVDSERRVVEAGSQFGHGGGEDHLVDLDGAQQGVLGEPVEQAIHDLRYGRRGSPQVEARSFAERVGQGGAMNATRSSPEATDRPANPDRYSMFRISMGSIRPTLALGRPPRRVPSFADLRLALRISTRGQQCFPPAAKTAAHPSRLRFPPAYPHGV